VLPQAVRSSGNAEDVVTLPQLKSLVCFRKIKPKFILSKIDSAQYNVMLC